MDQILTPDQSIEARNAIGLSQSYTAKAIGLNRSYLSEFETEKRMLEDCDLLSLRNYYLNLGWSEHHPAPTPNIIDSLVISTALLEDEVESLINDYRATQEKISELESEAAPRNIFGGIKENEALSKSFRVMIQYVSLQRLQRKIIGEDQVQDTHHHKETYTISNYIDYIINLLENNAR